MLILLLLLFLLGASIGSFINVVIDRLPMMIKHYWLTACRAYLNEHTIDGDHSTVFSTSQCSISTIAEPYQPPLSLTQPNSFCLQCGQPILWRHLIPLISYWYLAGRCAHCQHRIPMRVVFNEYFAACCLVAITCVFGVTVHACLLFIFVCFSQAMVFIDWKHKLLPDELTLPLLWIGLLANCVGTFTPLKEAVLGAVLGYISLWLVGHTYTLLSQRQGIGHGDYKLFAALGAWQGWQMLPAIALLASTSGLLFALFTLGWQRLSRQSELAFGPHLLVGALILLFWSQISRYSAF